MHAAAIVIRRIKFTLREDIHPARRVGYIALERESADDVVSIGRGGGPVDVNPMILQEIGVADDADQARSSPRLVVSVRTGLGETAPFFMTSSTPDICWATNSRPSGAKSICEIQLNPGPVTDV